jgi:hypothetical protein
LRRQDPNESEEEDFPSNLDQVNQGSQGTSVAEAEGAAHEQTQVRPTRTNETEQAQDTQEYNSIGNQEVERSGSTNDRAQDNQVKTKGKKKVGYRTEGVHTRSKTKKAAMVSIEEDLCFFMGQEDPKTYSQAMKSDKSRTSLSL